MSVRTQNVLRSRTTARGAGRLGPWTGATAASAPCGPWPRHPPPATVYDALEQVEDHPRWRPQVREVNRIDDTSGIVRIRSLLPCDLTFTAHETRRDPAAGVLEIAMTGDLDGWARWTLTAAGPGTRARYDQEVDVTNPLMRRLAVPGRPLFLTNPA